MKLVLILVLAMWSLTSKGQEAENGKRITTIYSGFTVGVGYPYLNEKSSFLNRPVSKSNYGFFGGYTFGKVFDSKLSFGVHPGLHIISMGDHQITKKKFSPITGNLSYESHGSSRFHFISIEVPVIFDIPLKRNFFQGGFYLLQPLAGGGYNKGSYKYYSHALPTEYNYAYGFEIEKKLRLGLSAGLFFQVSKMKSSDNYLGILYHHDVSYTLPGYSYQRGFYIEFIRRKTETKEVREKWDRYWMKN